MIVKLLERKKPKLFTSDLNFYYWCFFGYHVDYSGFSVKTNRAPLYTRKCKKLTLFSTHFLVKVNVLSLNQGRKKNNRYDYLRFNFDFPKFNCFFRPSTVQYTICTCTIYNIYSQNIINKWFKMVIIWFTVMKYICHKIWSTCRYR